MEQVKKTFNKKGKEKNISYKLFFKRLFCKHKNFSYYVKNEKYHNLNGDVVYHICDDCGKIIDTEFVNNEELMRRFRF